MKPLLTLWVVISLSITISGEKRFLGFVETDTKNAKVLTPFLRSLVERGLARTTLAGPLPETSSAV